ncbi:MAG: ATP-dependent 6-phosphofructokinase [Fimbriimonadales bacterium]
MNRFAILTSGGDAPGMNAATRAAVRAGIARGAEVIGVQRGYDGLQNAEFQPLLSKDVGAIITRGGTMLRSARSESFMETSGRRKAAEVMRSHGIEGLIVIGGDGSLTGAQLLFEENAFPVFGIPGSIDNDIPMTANSIGFQTAVDTALSAIDKVRDTAYSHERVFVIEVMGRRTGFIAIEAGLAGGAEAIIIPERKFDLEAIADKLDAGRKRGKKSSIVVVAEGAMSAMDVCKFISQRMGYQARYLVLGHMQRGGSPCAYDRVLATRMGAFAANRLIDGGGGEYVCLQNSQMVAVSLKEGLASPRPVDEERLRLAEVVST